MSTRRSPSTVSGTSWDAVGAPATTATAMSPASSRSSTASLLHTKMSHSMPGCRSRKRASSVGSRYVPTVVEPPTSSRPDVSPLTCCTAATASSASRNTRLPYSASTSPSAVGRAREPERSIRVTFRDCSSRRTWLETDG
nr:hypothetical protein [Streptomyces sp. PKU-EA00015]